MRVPGWVFTAVLFVAQSAAAQHAEGAGHAAHEAGWKLIAFHTLGLIVLLSVIGYFAGESLRNFMRDRSDGLRRQLDAARAALARAEEANAEISARLARIAEENDTLVRETADVAERERERALERARAAADRVREEAKRAADQEIERARAALQSEAAKLAVSLAGDMVRQSLTPDDERRMVSEFVSRIGDAS